MFVFLFGGPLGHKWERFALLESFLFRRVFPFSLRIERRSATHNHNIDSSIRGSIQIQCALFRERQKKTFAADFCACLISISPPPPPPPPRPPPHLQSFVIVVLENCNIRLRSQSSSPSPPSSHSREFRRKLFRKLRLMEAERVYTTLLLLLLLHARLLRERTHASYDNSTPKLCLHLHIPIVVSALCAHFA